MTEEEYLILIGKNISTIRKKNGLTLEELGFLCDMEKTNLSPIENGRGNVTALTLYKIAAALQVEVQAFFEFEKNNK